MSLKAGRCVHSPLPPDTRRSPLASEHTRRCGCRRHALKHTRHTHTHAELRCDVFPSLPLNSERGLVTTLLCLLLLSSELQLTCSPGRGPPGPASHSPSLPQGIWEGFCPVCGGNSPCELDPIAQLAGDSAPPAATFSSPLQCPHPSGPC